MEPRIETLSEKKLVGKRMKMSLANNKTFELWSSFMPRRKDIKNNIGTELFSMQVYAESFDFKDFSPNTEFEKWAAAEVAGFGSIPDQMESYVLPGGMYAVFIYKGVPAAFSKMFQFIFETWLPASGYILDKRPHFELLGEKYKNNDPDSEEEIWIPIRQKE